MSAPSIPPSMPLPDKDPHLSTGPSDDTKYSTTREVIQQFTTGTTEMENMFTVETNVNDNIILKVFDNWGHIISAEISYDTAHLLQTALSNAMDDLEAAMGDYLG